MLFQDEWSKNLLDLHSNHAVLGSAVEQLDGSTVSNALDVGLVGISLLEEIHNGLYTLLGELLVALGGTGLLVGVTVDQELGVTVNYVVCEVLKVSFFTL